MPGQLHLVAEKTGITTMASPEASDYVDAPYPTMWQERVLPLLLTWCLELEAQLPLSHKLNLRDTKVGAGRGTGPWLGDPEGCGQTISSAKTLGRCSLHPAVHEQPM